MHFEDNLDDQHCFHLQSGGRVACQADDRLCICNARVIEHAGDKIEHAGDKVEHAGER